MALSVQPARFGQCCFITMSDGSSYGPFTVGSGPVRPPGPVGPTGPTGEVTLQQLTDTLAGTALHPGNVAPLTFTVSDPPAAAQLQAVLDKLNELILALKRTS